MKQSLRRVDADGRKSTYTKNIANLLDGAFIARDEYAYLGWQDALLLWTPAEYVRRIPRPLGEAANLLTLRSITLTVAARYAPETPATPGEQTGVILKHRHVNE